MHKLTLAGRADEDAVRPQAPTCIPLRREGTPPPEGTAFSRLIAHSTGLAETFGTDQCTSSAALALAAKLPMFKQQADEPHRSQTVPSTGVYA